MAQPITLTDFPEVAPLTLSGDDQGPTLPAEVASDRASKAAWGLQPKMDYNEIFDGIINGDEKGVRNRAASLVDLDKRNSIRDVIDDPRRLEEAFTSQPVGSVFEDQYAKQYLSHFYNDVQDDDSTFNQMAKVAPDVVARNIAVGEQDLAWSQLIKNKRLDAEAALKKQQDQDTESIIHPNPLPLGVLNPTDLLRMWDILKRQFPAYEPLKARQVSGGYPKGLGSQLEAEFDAYTRMPYSEKSVKFVDAMDELIKADPALAVKYASYMQSPSFQAKTQANVETALDVAMTVLPVVGERMTRSAINAEMRRMVTEATAAADAGPMESAAAHGTGDNVTAGVTKVSSELASQLKDSHQLNQENIQRDITSVFKGDADAVTAGGPGNLGAEPANRLREFLDSNLGAVLNALKNTNRVDRLGEALNDRSVLMKAYEQIKNHFPGTAGNVLNIMPIKHALETNTYSADLIFGRNDGSFFGSAREAEKWAEANNIDLNNFHGVPFVGKQAKPTGGAVGTVEGLLSPEGKSNLDQIAKQVLDRANELYEKGDPTYIEVLKDYAKYNQEAAKGVYSQGKGFYIAYNIPLKEPENFLKEAVINTARGKNKNNGYINSWGFTKYVRGAGDVLSEQEMDNRRLASFAPAIFKRMVVDALQPTVLAKQRLRGQNWYDVWNNFNRGRDFDQFVNAMQAAQKDLKTISEFEEAWQAKFGQGQLPDEVQTAGYFALKQGEAMDYIFRNIAEYKNARRLGGEMHTLVGTDEKGVGRKSQPFVGIVQQTVPETDQNVAVQLGTNSWKVTSLKNHLRSEAGQLDAEAIKTGTKRLVRPYAPELNQIGDFIGSDKPIGYVLSDKMETRPLDFLLIPRRPGGHLEYKYDWYLKQPNIRSDTDENGFTTHYYEGDTTAMAVDSRAMGQDAKKVFDKIRIAVRDGDIDAAKLAARDIQIPWETIKDSFIGKNKRYNLNQPFYVVSKGKTVKDQPNHFQSLNVEGKSKFKDMASPGGSLRRQFQVEFTGERDAYDVMAMHRDGTSWNPTFAYRPADLVDPWSSINRATTRITNSLYMDDIKIQSIEGWITRYRDQLTATPAEFQENPYKVFAEDKLRSDIDPLLAASINAERYAIRAFAGIPSSIDKGINAIENKLRDSIYGARDPINRAAAQIGRFSFNTAVKAPAFLRAVAYRADIGLFAIPQLLVQNMSYVNIAGLAGIKKAGQGTAAALLHQYSRLPIVNDEVSRSLDGIAQKMGWRPGEWIEARNELGKTGFEYVSHESNATLWQGHMYPHKIAQTAWGNFLDMGEIFFKGGERNVRYGAWYTAFKEFRDLNPTGRLTLSNRNAILARADFLSGEMTKASKSALQAGPLSFTSQFLGYNLRLMEQFLGKRTTPKQKANLLFWNAAMYGVPIAAGVAIPGASWIKQIASRYGYVEGEKPIADNLMHGVPAYLMRLASGDSYNVGERFGPNNPFEDALSSDKTFWRVASGAVGSLAVNVWEKMYPFTSQWARAINGENIHNITADDLVAPLKESAAVNTWSRYLQAMATGDWLSKNGTTMAQGVNPWNALYMSITGLSPRPVENNETYKEIDDAVKANYEQAEKIYVTEYTRAMRVLKNNPEDPQGANVHFKNAESALIRYNYPIGRKDALWARANEAAQGTLPSREAIQHYLGRDVPSNQVIERASQYGRQDIQGNVK